MTTGTRPTARWKTIVVYVIMVLLTLAFLATGIFKLTGNEMQVANFTRWGYPLWFMYLTGLIELVSVVLMWIPRTRFFGAAGLVCVMVGAALTHLTHGEAGMVPAVIVLLALSAVVAWANRPAQLLQAKAA